jgi:prolyl 4-hydroxylase
MEQYHLDQLIASLEEQKRLNSLDEGGMVYLADLKESRLAMFGELEPLVFPSATLDLVINRCDVRMQENFLVPFQCQKIIDYAKAHIIPSTTMGKDLVDKDYRTSSEIGLTESENNTDDINALVRNIRSNIACLSTYPASHQETLSIIKYKKGEEYKPHHDYFSDAEKEAEHVLRNGGERLMSFLICLQPPEKGGDTEFPLLNLKIKQEQGKIIYWNNTDPQVTTLYEESLHAGLPVEEGEKWIMTCWIRQKPIITL